MGEFIRMLHWSVRYFVLLSGLVAIVVSMTQWRRTPASGLARVSAAAFTGSIDLQLLIGIFMLLTRPFYGALIGHITMMILAGVIAHVGSIRARRLEPNAPGAKIRAFAFTIALVLIVGGLMAINRPIL